jgi:hypothetical protein
VESLDDVFAALHPLLARHAESLVVVADEPGDIQVQTRRLGPSGTALSFGALKTGEGSVRLALMPVYSHPALLEGLSDDLRARMQGKGSFDFTPQTLSPELVEELSALVDAGLARYRADRLA